MDGSVFITRQSRGMEVTGQYAIDRNNLKSALILSTKLEI